MSDNTLINVGSGGDTIRTIARGSVKTEVVQLDMGGEAGPESLVTTLNPLPVLPIDLPSTNELLYRILITLQSMQIQDAQAYGVHVDNAELSSEEEFT